MHKEETQVLGLNIYLSDYVKNFNYFSSLCGQEKSVLYKSGCTKVPDIRTASEVKIICFLGPEGSETCTISGIWRFSHRKYN